MAAVGRTDTGNIEVGAVGVGGVAMVVVLRDNIIFLLALGQRETTFAVSHPDAQLRSTERVEHHTLVLRNSKCEEAALELARHVVEHLCLSRLVDESQFHHQLATVADAERQRVLAGIEAVEGLFCLGVVKEGASPTLCRAEHVAIRESTTEHNHVDFVERLATRDEIGHHDILHIEASQVEAVSHFAFAIGALLADDGCLRTVVGSNVAATVEAQAILAQTAREATREFHLQRLLLVVLEAFASHAIATLTTIEQIAGLIPHIAQMVDVECHLVIVSLDDELTPCLNGIANLCKAYSHILQIVAEVELMLVAHLDDHTGILSEECFDDVAIGTDVVQINMYAALLVGKCHLKECGNQATS